MEKRTTKIETIRHSLSHIMACAVQELYPAAPTKSGRASPKGRGVKFGIGPAIENGFYYDFALPSDLSAEARRAKAEALAKEGLLPRIEEKMREILKENIIFKKKIIKKTEAKKIFKNQPYKLELISELPGKTVTIYESGNFIDLCAGPHVKLTKEIPADGFKLTRIAGAYWRGDEKKPMLTRIYGVAFQSKKELDDYLKLQEEAEKRDHRVLGKNLDLFIFSDLVGKGLPLFTEKGSVIRRELERFIVDEEIKRGYKHVYTPELAKVELYKVSGHYPYYKDTMYPVMKIDEEELILRPMTCPHHYQLYASRPRSYKELPFRIAELAKQFRYEKSGELTGLMRVRSFCLADAHIICAKEQAAEELQNVLDLIEYIASVLEFKKGEDYRYRLSLGNKKNKDKYYKDDKAWDFAENVLRSALKKRESPFFEAKGEAAFYGPKIDIQMKNFAGKEDTAFTVQYDFVGPKRFKLAYIDNTGTAREPIVIHRSSIGAIERTMAFLIERNAGAFPFWLSPTQILIIPINDGHKKYAEAIGLQLTAYGLRLAINNEKETVGKKIRESELQKIPYVIVVGDKEMQAKSIRVRERGKGDIGEIRLEEFIKKIQKETRPRG